MAENPDKPRNAKGNQRGMNPNSRANLKPGLNPNGRPPKLVCVTSWLKEYADKRISDNIDPKALTYAQLAALSAWRAAAKGDLSQYNFIIDRIEGKVTASVDVTSKGKEIQQAPVINVVSDNAKQLTEQILAGKGTECATPDH
jgi:hypothetical protein